MLERWPSPDNEVNSCLLFLGRLEAANGSRACRRHVSGGRMWRKDLGHRMRRDLVRHGCRGRSRRGNNRVLRVSVRLVGGPVPRVTCRRAGNGMHGRERCGGAIGSDRPAQINREHVLRESWVGRPPPPQALRRRSRRAWQPPRLRQTSCETRASSTSSPGSDGFGAAPSAHPRTDPPQDTPSRCVGRGSYAPRPRGLSRIVMCERHHESEWTVGPCRDSGTHDRVAAVCEPLPPVPGSGQDRMRLAHRRLRRVRS